MLLCASKEKHAHGGAAEIQLKTAYEKPKAGTLRLALGFY